MRTALLCFALLTVPCHRVSEAECLVPRPPCEALAAATIVAVVDVIEAAEPFERSANQSRPIPQAVRLRIVERFKGVSPLEREISGKIHNNAESVFLAAGKRYLLYVHQLPDGIWWTSCTRTKAVQAAKVELSQLRQCVQK